jgi:hypothetical protein
MSKMLEQIQQAQPEHVAKHRNSVYFMALDDSIKESELIQLNTEYRTKNVVKHSTLKQMFGPNVVHTRQGAVTNWQLYTAYLAYRPDINKVFYTQNGNNYINTYEPPEFRLEEYWTPTTSETKYPEVTRDFIEYFDELPKPIFGFLNHLTNYEADSMQYLMEWLATAVTPGKRNITTLVLISTPGVGKGVFFDSIITPLFGEHNVRLVRGEDALGGRFNASLHERQVVMFDESNLKDPSAINRFKALANSTLEIEQKGKDTFQSKNWLNTILASNSLDSIEIETNDRRYSVLQTANQTLEKMVVTDGYGTVTELKRQLEDPSNIKVFYDWLRSLKVERNMNIPFKAFTKTAEIKDAGFSEWEHSVIEYLNQLCSDGQSDITLIALQEYMISNNIGRYRTGRGKMADFTNKTAGAYSFKQDSKTGKHFIRISYPYKVKTSTETADMTQPPPSTTKAKLGVVK